MTSSVSICNQALSWLGADQIISLDDESAEAKTCKANYEPIRDAVIEVREWTFAVRRMELTPMVKVPAYGYGTQFLIPSDVIRILSIPSANSNASTMGLNGAGSDWYQDVEFWRVESVDEGRVILANRDKLAVRVLWRITNEALFSPTFVQAFAARLAAEMTMPLVESRQLQADMHQLYGIKLAEAAAVDGTQGRSEIVRSDWLKRVR